MSEQHSNKDDQFFLEFGKLIKNYPAKSITLIFLSITFIYGLSWKIENLLSSVDKNRVKAEIENAYRSHNLKIPAENDIVQLIQNFSNEITINYKNKQILLEKELQSRSVATSMINEQSPNKSSPNQTTNIELNKTEGRLKTSSGSTKTTKQVNRFRIVVVPFYFEQGEDASEEHMKGSSHYRRMSGFIVNQLVKHNFEVVNPFARDAQKKELNRVMERAKEDSMLVATDLCMRYGVDATYLVWLKVKLQETSDGLFKATAIVDGEGYNSAGIALGANLSKTFNVTRSDSDLAIREVEKEIGDLVGRRLTDWRTTTKNTSDPQTLNNKGVLIVNMDKQASHIKISLDGANEYELIEVFGKILRTVPGVVNANLVIQRIIPDNPQECVAEWAVELDTSKSDTFRLQTSIMKMINDILESGGSVTLKGVPYRYTPSEIRMMMGLRPSTANSRVIRFIIDRDRARDREFSSIHEFDS
ncbi:MAG: hypothetical protein MI892_12300 [Desulfobacterales bacterium]|nr:hypothetical protein [Desulfobacterales bacterium]